MWEFFDASRWGFPLESHLCTSFDLHPIMTAAWLPEPLPIGLPCPEGVEEAPFGGTPAGGEG
jgi:hypothetical protein